MQAAATRRATKRLVRITALAAAKSKSAITKAGRKAVLNGSSGGTGPPGDVGYLVRFFEGISVLRLTVEYAEGGSDKADPCAFAIGARRVAVKEVVDRWPAVGYRYVKVFGDDAATYILRFDEDRLEWELTLFEAARA